MWWLFKDRLSLYDACTVPLISYWSGEWSLWLLLLLIPNVIFSAVMTSRGHDAKH